LLFKPTLVFFVPEGLGVAGSENKLLPDARRGLGDPNEDLRPLPPLSEGLNPLFPFRGLAEGEYGEGEPLAAVAEALLRLLLLPRAESGEPVIEGVRE